MSGDDSQKCWAASQALFYTHMSGTVDIPCNEPGVPPLYLCEQHDAEVRQSA